MRQMISSGSVKAFYLDREKVLKRLKELSKEAITIFKEIKEIRIFGSFAKKLETGLSDIDLFILVENGKMNPIDRMRPYFNFFSDGLGIAIDVIVANENEAANFKEILKNSILLSYTLQV